MKNIFLVGDSIRFGAPNPSKYNNVSPGYGIYVKEKLAGIANVYGPDENCRFAQFTLRFLQKWAGVVLACLNLRMDDKKSQFSILWYNDEKG